MLFIKKTKLKFSARWVNLAADKLGARVIDCSDEFFAPAARMLQTNAPVFIADKFDDHGKWMDGWETRRRRSGGNDWCIIKLARAGVLHGVEINTAHFTGNHPAAASIQAGYEKDAATAPTDWVEILSRQELAADSMHRFNIDNPKIFNQVRLNIFPDGGIARLNIYAQPYVDWQSVRADELIDLAAALNGGVAIKCSDEHFGTMNNLLSPGRGVNMGDGWETRRRRGDGHDWVIISLAHRGLIKKIEVDTAHFKGNYPQSCSLQGANLNPNAGDLEDYDNWFEILPQSELSADHQHTFSKQIISDKEVTHVRFNIFPDGGVSRLRLFAHIK